MVEAPAARGSQSSLREANSASIVEAVRIYGQITQVELAAATGLSPATVSNLVKSLQSAGIVETSATVRSGRRAQAVSLARSSDLGVGVHIGHRTVEVLLADASWSVTATQRLPLPADHRFDTTLDRVALLVAELTERVGATPSDIGTVGLAIPGSALAGWEQVDVADILSRRLQRPISLVSETDAVGIAETRFGALRGVGSAMVIRASHTTEASVLLHGRPLPAGGGFGHVRVDPTGLICWCGARGCLNTVVSLDALTDLLRVSHGPLSLRALVQRAKDGDAGCRQAVAHAADVIGAAAADAAMLFAPERICFTGELVSTGDVFLGPVRAAFRARPLLADVGSLAVVADCADAEARGALALATDDAGPGAEGAF
ncbi:MAG: ROK family transcriptional regulator [Tessaracoccus sp.]|uniref:ROK family transcriptional regulator n=1 Tax=Tessaracoccus sp. TaxID=1971211 RepID=UPI001EBB204F|nr:ROK family transcriptional regulator [Tessaracoccus sp.]MBK7820002.1 ROK family transcriptional regulator [Tessaracoccus sp.]